MNKWLFLITCLFLVTTGVGLGLSGYQKGQCRVEALKIGKSAEDIAKICK